MTRWKRLLMGTVGCLLLIGGIQVAFSDVQNSLVNFLDSMGYSGNATSANAYQGQEAGYYSAGSEYLRSSTSMLNLIQVSVPHINAGCGGIDIFNGGMSYVNNAQLTQFFKNTMQSASGYLFNLALKTEVPEISEALDEAQSWAEKINANNLTSCQLSQDLVGGLLPQTSESQRQICRDIGAQDNVFEDWTSARLNCGEADSEDAKKALDDASKDSTYKQFLPKNLNIVWQALGEIQAMQNDQQLKAFVQAITGTYIFDDKGNLTRKPSLLSDDTVKAIMYGGTASVYICSDNDTDQCLTVQKESVNIAKSDSFYGQTMKMLETLESSLQNDTALTDEEKGFLNLTSLPVLKMMSNNLASGDRIDMENYADLIAADLANQYLQQLVQAVKIGSGKFSQTSQAINQMVQSSIRDVRETLNSYAGRNRQTIQMTMMFIAEGQSLERTIASNVTNVMKTNPNWGVNSA